MTLAHFGDSTSIFQWLVVRPLPIIDPKLEIRVKIPGSDLTSISDFLYSR